MLYRTNPACLPEVEAIVTRTIGCALRVHQSLGPGFTEGLYHDAMEIDLTLESLWSGLMRVRALRSLVLLAGVGVARNAADEARIYTESISIRGPQPPVTTYRGFHVTSAALVLGLDTPIGLSKHVDVVPAVRAFRVGPLTDDQYGGEGWTTRATIGVLVKR